MGGEEGETVRTLKSLNLSYTGNREDRAGAGGNLGQGSCF